MCDTGILRIIANEVYKGDYVHGKKTNHPTYYKDVVEPIVSKELWENCQVQKKKNQKNYMRTQTYIFLQKLKCPKCGRILAGGASHKIKSDKWYFYYRCENCKNNIHENKIEEHIKTLLADILEYDNVVNEFFLPVLKSKVDNPKIELEKELKNLNNKKGRIRKAYIDELFTEEEFKQESKLIENEALNLRVKTLNDIIKEKDNEISFLKSKINDLKNTIEYWKDKFEKLISFLDDKLHSWYDKDDKYIDVVNDMYEDNVLADDDIEELDLNKEKDDFER